MEPAGILGDRSCWSCSLLARTLPEYPLLALTAAIAASVGGTTMLGPACSSGRDPGDDIGLEADSSRGFKGSFFKKRLACLNIMWPVSVRYPGHSAHGLAHSPLT